MGASGRTAVKVAAAFFAWILTTEREVVGGVVRDGEHDEFGRGVAGVLAYRLGTNYP